MTTLATSPVFAPTLATPDADIVVTEAPQAPPVAIRTSRGVVDTIAAKPHRKRSRTKAVDEIDDFVLPTGTLPADVRERLFAATLFDRNRGGCR